MNALFEFIKMLFNPPGQERPSPGSWMPNEAFGYDPATSIFSIDFKSLQTKFRLSQPPLFAWNAVPNTNSMDPVFDAGHLNILISGATPEDHAKLVTALQVGDIAVYSLDGTSYIIHRIIKISSGKYSFAGDNNSGVVDKPDVRADQIKFISLGTIYRG